MQKEGTVRDVHEGNYLPPLTRNLTEMLLKTSNGIAADIPKKISFFFPKRQVQEVQVLPKTVQVKGS